MVANKWKSASLSHVGNVRKVNEDSMLDAPQLGLWVVADGMGGHSAGDIASQMIVSTLGALQPAEKLSQMAECIEDTLTAVNQELLKLADTGGARRVIGSTVVALAATKDHAFCAWVGDSRLYRLRQQTIEQLSQDHSQVEEMVMRGELLRETAEKHPDANIITRAVGADALLNVDFEWIDLKAGDRYLLCSDGLYKELDDDVIGEIMLKNASPEQASQALVSAALDHGCRDNVSVVVVNF